MLVPWRVNDGIESSSMCGLDRDQHDVSKSSSIPGLLFSALADKNRNPSIPIFQPKKGVPKQQINLHISIYLVIL